MQNRSNHSDLPKPVQRERGLSTLPDLNGKPMSANGLRNGLYRALSRVSLQKRVLLYKKLIRDLEKVGINVGSRLFLLGITAKTPQELTPNDIGKLIRSIYLNEPLAFAAISPMLNEILSKNVGQKLPHNSISQPKTSRR